jgi:hypothetical protein
MMAIGDQVLRKILGPRRHEGVNGYKEVHNEEHHNLYSSPNTVWVM